VCTCDDPDHDRQPDQVKVIISTAGPSAILSPFDKKLKDFRNGGAEEYSGFLFSLKRQFFFFFFTFNVQLNVFIKVRHNIGQY
jgi:hypothetical protein